MNASILSSSSSCSCRGALACRPSALVGGWQLLFAVDINFVAFPQPSKPFITDDILLAGVFCFSVASRHVTSRLVRCVAFLLFALLRDSGQHVQVAAVVTF